jgi:hypothetical protein
MEEIYFSVGDDIITQVILLVAMAVSASLYYHFLFIIFCLLSVLNFAKTTDRINVHEITIRMISETPSLFSKSELSVLRYDT